MQKNLVVRFCLRQAMAGRSLSTRVWIWRLKALHPMQKRTHGSNMPVIVTILVKNMSWAAWFSNLGAFCGVAERLTWIFLNPRPVPRFTCPRIRARFHQHPKGLGTLELILVWTDVAMCNLDPMVQALMKIFPVIFQEHMVRSLSHSLLL